MASVKPACIRMLNGGDGDKDDQQGLDVLSIAKVRLVRQSERRLRWSLRMHFYPRLPRATTLLACWATTLRPYST